MAGFIKLHRGWRNNPVFKGEYSRADAWLWLIENACWKASKFDIKGKTVELQRGQICASREQLSDTWGWSPSAVERFLTRLKTEQMIGRETGQGKSIITICNYAKYQDSECASGQETGQETGHKSDRNRTAKEEGKEREEETIAKAIDAGASSDKLFWDNGKAYLRQYIKGDPGALIGKWAKQHGKTETAKAITAAQLERPVEPVPYIERVLNKARSQALPVVGI